MRDYFVDFRSDQIAVGLMMKAKTQHRFGVRDPHWRRSLCMPIDWPRQRP
ncbi:hypothetical protein ABC977_12470 [Thioalkalicoccus limnaeus]|uniref:Uncharacterized protein n=1 Tax=Thioalkalicoccus limnaeus TaxID=120681 RepID=A0ABV4BFD7_9GAMM